MVDCDFYGDLDSTEFFERENKPFTIQPIKVEKVRQFKLLFNFEAEYMCIYYGCYYRKRFWDHRLRISRTCGDRYWIQYGELKMTLGMANWKWLQTSETTDGCNFVSKHGEESFHSLKTAYKLLTVLPMSNRAFCVFFKKSKPEGEAIANSAKLFIKLQTIARIELSSSITQFSFNIASSRGLPVSSLFYPMISDRRIINVNLYVMLLLCKKPYPSTITFHNRESTDVISRRWCYFFFPILIFFALRNKIWLHPINISRCLTDGAEHLRNSLLKFFFAMKI